jgi:arsenite methyltransferase
VFQGKESPKDERRFSMKARPMSESLDQNKTDIKQRFVKVALEPQAKQRHPIGPASAKRLGYDAAEIDALPAQVTESFAGVGNPLALGELRAGDTVLDIGCGAGVDSILAARRVGPSGRVVGVDMTEEMVKKAKDNAVAAGVTNTEFHTGEADRLPVENGTVDVAISNGVFNLCFDKPKVLAEVFRVLRPGGRIQMADVMLDERMTTQQVDRKGAWSD